MDLGLKGRAVLCTASSRGIGFAVARRFLEAGARVLITARSEQHLTQARESLAELPGELATMIGDVTDAAACQEMVSNCQQEFGRLDVLFTNAGGPPSGTFAELTPDQYQHALELNLLSVVHLSRAAVPIMQQQQYGRIVALTSLSVKQPVDGLLLSNMARAGVQGFLKTLATETARDGITVNNVCPGYTATERLDELAQAASRRQGVTPEQVFESWSASIPAGRLGRPEEIAAAVVFFASEPASYITGTALAVDGGATRSLL